MNADVDGLGMPVLRYTEEQPEDKSELYVLMMMAAIVVILILLKIIGKLG